MSGSSATESELALSSVVRVRAAPRAGSALRKILREGAIILAIWTFIAFLNAGYAGISDSQPVKWGQLILFHLGHWYALGLFTPVFLWMVRRWPLRPGHWKAVSLYLVSIPAFAPLQCALFWRVRMSLIPGPSQTFGQTLAKWFFYQLFTTAGVVGVLHAIEYAQLLKERELRASRLAADLSNARLQVLRSELQPHFLFNALHSISALMHRNVEAADEMITQLGDLLRLTLERKGVQEVPLREELSLLDRYLGIMRIRFGDRLVVKVDVDPAQLDVRVPLFVLQPLVENAIHHGIERHAGAGKIAIRAAAAGESLQITVSDDGPGVEGNSIKEGVGLSNTKMRLEHLYGPKAQLALKNHSESGLEVVLTIPRSVA